MRRKLLSTAVAAVALAFMGLPVRPAAAANLYEPVAVDDAYSTHIGTPFTVAAPGVLANDYDLDGDVLTAWVLANPNAGTLDFHADGSFSYTPQYTFVGNDQFQYVVEDGQGGQSIGKAVITFTDNPPSAIDHTYTSGQAGITIPAPGVLVGASDPDGDPTTEAYMNSGPSHGWVYLQMDGSFTYTPEAGYLGTDTFTYMSFDGVLPSAPATVTIEVVHLNSPPIAAYDGPFPVTHGQTITQFAPGVLSNDWDPDSDPISVVSYTQPAYGTVTVDPDGGWSYANTAWSGLGDNFTYTIADPKGATSTAVVTISIMNYAPVAADQEYQTEAGVPLEVSAPGLLSGAFDPDGDPVVLKMDGLPSHGSFSWGQDGSFTYTPDPGYLGDDIAFFYAYDGLWNSDQHHVTFHVGPPNNPPVPVDDWYSVAHGKTLFVDWPGVLANDTDADGDTLYVAWWDNPYYGTISGDYYGGFTYTPTDPSFVGTDYVYYYVIDGRGGAAWGVASIEVTNAAPTALDHEYTTLAGTALNVSAPGFMTGAADTDGDVIGGSVWTLPGHGSLSWATDGSFDYTPNPGFVGDDSFAFVASDSIVESGLHTVTIHVLSPDQAPVAVGDVYTARKNNVLTVGAPGVLGNDSDPNGDAMTAVKVTGPSHGTLVFNANGSFKYTPARGYSGLDSFTYKVLANGKYSNTVTVTLNVIVPKK